jgi:hypothetical protein
VLVASSPFLPDVVETPSAEAIRAFEQATQSAGAGTPTTYELPPGARGVRLQLTAVQVMRGMAGFAGRPAAGGVYLISSVVDGVGDQPIAFQGKVYQGIQDGDLLPLGRAAERDAVFTVYLREREMPRLLSFSLLVLKSNAGLRELGRVLTQTTRDERFSKLSELVTAAAGAANPAFGVVWQAADEAIGLVGSYLEAKQDDQLGYYQANYTNLFDDLGMGKHPPDAPTIAVDKIRFGYEINVAL